MIARVLLCDADGNLFPSEEPAFEASTQVTNALLSDLGVDRRFTPDELRRGALGRNFRAIACDLVREHGVELDDGVLEGWVRREREEVTAHLARVLRPDPAVREPLARVAALGHRLAVVSSSATPRLAACFEATGLDELFPPEVRYSAEDSLPAPASKPDPAVYVHAGSELGVAGDEALAIEDAVAGVASAVAAGFPVVGNLQFVPEGEREGRARDLLAAGAACVVASWDQLEGMLHAGGLVAMRSMSAAGER